MPDTVIILVHKDNNEIIRNRMNEVMVKGIPPGSMFRNVNP